MESIDDDVFEIGMDNSVGMNFSDGGNVQILMQLTDRVLDGWSPNDGDIDICTVRTATYLSGSGLQHLHFRFQVMRGDYSDIMDVVDGTELLLSGLDRVS